MPKPAYSVLENRRGLSHSRSKEETRLVTKGFAPWPKKRHFFAGPGAAARSYPLPKRGILVAMMVMKGTLDSSGKPAMKATACAT